MTKMVAPFKEHLAVVYNEHMQTLGGGERSTLAYAKSLMNLGFSVEINSPNDFPSESEFVRIFGEEFRGIRIRKVSYPDFFRGLRSAQPTVFVNHSFMNFDENPARVGIYSQMFPASPIRRGVNDLEVANLLSYQLMLCNSSYTQTYTRGLWDFPINRVHVLHPPLGQQSIDVVNSRPLNAPKKKQFLHVGRFNPGMHNKNQKILMQCFLEAQSRYPSLAEWKFLFVGNVNQDPASQIYFQDCLDICKKSQGSIEIHQGVSTDKLQQQLAESFSYVHGTGAFLTPGTRPERCEHFGLSILEAMAQDCIPVVYARGGIFDYLEVWRGGLAYLTRPELVDSFSEIADLYGKGCVLAIRELNRQAVLKLSLEQFTKRLARFIEGELSHDRNSSSHQADNQNQHRESHSQDPQQDHWESLGTTQRRSRQTACERMDAHT